MKFFRNKIALFLTIAILSLSFSTVAYAEETPVSSELTAEQASSFIESIANHVSAYGRYDHVTTKSLFQAALDGIIEENPDLYTKALKSMLESVDQYSEYYTPEEAVELTADISGEITGIGVTLEFVDGSATIVSSVIPDTPAERAGLQVGDILIRANGTDLTTLQSETVLSLIRGDEGTTVLIDVERNGAILSFEIVREPIIGTSVTHSLYEEDGEKVFYIRVHGFIKNTAEKFAEALNEANSKNIKNLIIDLRDNGGGLLEQAVLMANLFVPKDKPITTEDHKNPIFNKTYVGTEKKANDLDIIILVNENSASASEVFAAALRENDLASLIGTKTYGKGTIQSLMALANGGMIKYTSGFYLTPLGTNIHGVGLTPDAYVENSLSPFDMSGYENFEYTRVYKEGDNGSEVLLAKRMLSTLGIYIGEINETFDRDLYYAVHSFQTRAGLFPYGVLDLTTQGQIRNYLATSKVENDDQLDAALAHFGIVKDDE